MGFEAQVEREVKVKVEVEAEAEVKVENSPYKTYKNTEDKVASKMKQILCSKAAEPGVNRFDNEQLSITCPETQNSKSPIA